jgi:pimeloyl-ACP methyl ester carboxylesterase
MTCAFSYAALIAANKRPDLFTHVVIAQTPELKQKVAWVKRMDPTGTMATAVWGQVAQWWNRERIARGWFVSALPNGSGILDGVTAKSIAMLRKGGSYCLASMFQAIVSADIARIEPLLRVTQPAGLMWGKMDRTHSKSDGRSTGVYLERTVGFEEAEFAHFPDLEEPERFAGMIVRVGEAEGAEIASARL